jgi:hypothetical protein
MPRNEEEYRKNSARESFDEHHILNAEPTSPEFLAATVHELSTKSSRNAAISRTTTIMATLSSNFSLSRRQFSQSSNHSQFEKSCHHHLIVRQDQNQVQDPRTRKLCHPSGPSCQFQEAQPWNSKLRSKETIISGL